MATVAFDVGDRLQACDRVGAWYDAKVVAARGEDDAREIKVHFQGWHARFDEWLQISSARLCPSGEEVPDLVEQAEVETVLKKRKRAGVDEYLVRWAGFSAEHDRWVSAEDIDPDLIDNFTAERVEQTAAEPTAAEPYVSTVAQPIAPEMAEVLVDEWEDDIGRKAVQLLSRASTEEWAARQFFSMSPCPPWLFLAIYERFKKRAVALTDEIDSEVDAHISELMSVKGARGGKYVEDQFEITSIEMVKKLTAAFNTAGHGALVMRPNKTAVMLVPPLQFRFRTQRQEGLEGRKWPTELVLTGHFMCLVDRKGKKPRWAFDDERATYSAENKLAYKEAVAAAVHELGPEVVPARILSFLSVLVD